MMKNVFFLVMLAAIGHAGDYEKEGCFSRICCFCKRHNIPAKNIDEAKPLLDEEQPFDNTPAKNVGEAKHLLGGGRTFDDSFVGKFFSSLPKRADFQRCTEIVVTYWDKANKKKDDPPRISQCVVPQNALTTLIQVDKKTQAPLWETYHNIVSAGVVQHNGVIRNASFFCQSLKHLWQFLQKNSGNNGWCSGDIPWGSIMGGYMFCVVQENDETLEQQEVTLTGTNTGWSLYGWKEPGVMRV